MMKTVDVKPFISFKSPGVDVKAFDSFNTDKIFVQS